MAFSFLIEVPWLWLCSASLMWFLQILNAFICHIERNSYFEAMVSTSVFRYDDLPEGYFRLFKLDLDGPPDQLTGKILSCYLAGQLDIMRKSMWKDFFGDTLQIMKFLSGGSGYDAISYAWGSSDAKHPLLLSTISNELIDGNVCVAHEPFRNGFLLINDNLHAFLQELRRRRYNKFLWIDAICINQSESQEKSVQIPRMKSIYETSDNVLLWLGQATITELDAIATLPTLTEKLQCASSLQDELDPGDHESFTKIDLPGPDKPSWKALGTLMMRPWWKRLWTLQEVVVALPYENPNVSVMCGSSTIKWADLDAFAVSMTSRHFRDWTITGDIGVSIDELHGYDSIDQIRACREALDWAIAGPPLLFATRGRLATDPADHVFGIMAMLSKATVRELGVDVSLPVKTVFVNYGKHYIRNETTECLLNHNSSVEKLDGLPSWCPNFASPEETVSLGSRWFGRTKPSPKQARQMYCAGFTHSGLWKRLKKNLSSLRGVLNTLSGRHSEENIFNTQDPRQISLYSGTYYIRARGMQVDEVVEFVDCNIGIESLQAILADSLQRTRDWEMKCFALAEKQLAKKDLLEIYSRALVANWIDMEPKNSDSTVVDNKHRYDFTSDFQSFKQQLQGIINRGKILLERKASNTALRYSRTPRQVTRRRRFFATQGGRIGLGPSDTSVGDIVCAIFYCPTLYLLRGGLEQKAFIGEAYVHGLMFGEALFALKEGKLEETSCIIQ